MAFIHTILLLQYLLSHEENYSSVHIIRPSLLAHVSCLLRLIFLKHHLNSFLKIFCLIMSCFPIFLRSFRNISNSAFYWTMSRASSPTFRGQPLSWLCNYRLSGSPPEFNIQRIIKVVWLVPKCICEIDLHRCITMLC